MKVKNIVFCGAMASILMMGVASAATDVTFAGKFSKATDTAETGKTGDIINSPIAEPQKDSSNYEYTNPEGASATLDSEGTDSIVRSDYKDQSDATTDPSDSDGVSVTNRDLISGMTMDSSNYHYTYDGNTYDLKVKKIDDELEAVANKKHNSDPIDLLDGEQSEGISVTQEKVIATNGESDFDASMFVITNEGHEYVLKDDGSDVKLYRKDAQQEGAITPETGTTLAQLFIEAKGYYDTAKEAVGNAEDETAGLVADELEQANKALDIYKSDMQTLKDLDTAWETLATARQNYKNDYSDFEASNAAIDVFNAPILETIDNEADSRIELALGNGGAIKTAIDAGDAVTLSEAQKYADAGDAKLRNEINALDSKVNELDENLSAGIASSVALSSVAVANVQAGEMSVGAGYGNYNSKSAVAFGAAMGITDNWSANAGVGLGFGKDTKASFRVGTNYKFKLF